ncbi:MAG: SulP family inorganic anion transporter [Burkholderiales bacterium]
MTRLDRLLPALSWPRPDAALLRNEALAGLTVGLMVIPQGVAYATLAGMPIVTGIYASMLPALVAVLFSASPRVSVGPTALSCLLVGASLTGMAVPGSPQWIAMAGWLALLSGGLQVLLGLLRAGRLLSLVSDPVMMAFTQAASLLIIASQLPALLGVQHLSWSALGSPHGLSAAFGLGSLALLMAVRRWKATFPSVLVVMLCSAGISKWIGFTAQGGKVIGALPDRLPSLSWPAFLSGATFADLVLPTLVITLVSCLETASSAKVDNERQGTRWNRNQDLIGQGLGKFAAGISGAFPTSASFSRSALNLYAGARTGWATIFSVVVVLLALLTFTPVLERVPQAVLAAVVLVAVIGLVRPQEFVRLWRVSRGEAVIALATFAITLLSAPLLYWGVIAGILMALSHFIYHRMQPRIIEVGLHADGSLRDRHLWNLPPVAPHVLALRMDAALDFATASTFEERVLGQSELEPGVKHVCLFAHAINRIDATGVATLIKVADQMHERGITLHLSGLKLPVETALQRAGVLLLHGGVRTYRNDGEALKMLSQVDAVPNDPAAASMV